MADKRVANEISYDVIASDVPKDISSLLDDSESLETEKQITEDSKEIDGLFKESYMKMDGKFLEYLDVFTKAMEKNEDVKIALKKNFFWVIMGLLIIIIMVLCAISIIAVIAKIKDATAIVAIGGMLIEGMTAILVLPKIIAEYLFNKEEEANRMEVIKSMQSYNDHKNTQNIEH